MKGTDILLTFAQKYTINFKYYAIRKYNELNKPLDTVTIITYIFYKGLHKK